MNDGSGCDGWYNRIKHVDSDGPHPEANSHKKLLPFCPTCRNSIFRKGITWNNLSKKHGVYPAPNQKIDKNKIIITCGTNFSEILLNRQFGVIPYPCYMLTPEQMSRLKVKCAKCHPFKPS